MSSMLFDVFKLTFASISSFVLLVIEPLYTLLTPRSLRREDISGKCVLITGGGSGIGRKVALNLSLKGANVISWDINKTGNEETAEMIRSRGGSCSTYEIDLCDRPKIYRTAAKVKEEHGKVDILINNAGLVNGRDFMDLRDEDIMRIFNVNLFSAMWTTKAFLPDMMKTNSGHIVTIASIAGYFGAARMTDYCASKAACVRFDEALGQEIDHRGYPGIYQTLVCPYQINTGMFDGCYSKILPPLDQDYVAAEITDAILMKSRELIMPRVLSIPIFLKGLLTRRGFELIENALGAATFMDTFTGKKQ